MAYMDWSDSYSVGVSAIDTQHKTLFSMVNELHAAMMRQEGKGAAGPMLAKLLKYTHDHFATEEQLMAATKYPEAVKHCAAHRDLSKKAEELSGRFQRGESGITVHLLKFVSDWLTQHIVKEDKLYAPWLKEHGVK